MKFPFIFIDELITFFGMNKNKVTIETFGTEFESKEPPYKIHKEIKEGLSIKDDGIISLEINHTTEEYDGVPVIDDIDLLVAVRTETKNYKDYYIFESMPLNRFMKLAKFKSNYMDIFD